MKIVAAPRILLKLDSAQTSKSFGIGGNSVQLRELCPNDTRPRQGLAAGSRWYIGDFGGSIAQADAWDVAYDAARAHGAYAEPDVARLWEYRNPVAGALGAAPGELCAYSGQRDGFPKGNGFAWHLCQSGLLPARREIEQTKDRSRVRIGILDTGYDPGHNACPENILTGLERNFVDDGQPANSAVDPYPRALFSNPGHGTGTIGILAGGRLKGMALQEQNGDYLGGAPLAEILPVRIAPAVVLLYTSAFAQGLDYLIAPGGNGADRVDVVSMSMGGVASRAWADVVNRAYDSGIVLVTAAGNNFPATPRSIVYPARFLRVIAACGVMADGTPYIRDRVPLGEMAGNWGPPSKMAHSALAAYTPNTPWAEINCKAIVDMDGQGTSSATPQVAAAAALWLQKHKPAMKGWSGFEVVEAVRHALFRSANAALPDSATYFGRGVLRADAALAVAPLKAAAPTAPDTAEFTFWKVVLGRGLAVDGTDPLHRMLGVEVAQLFQVDPDVAESMDDPDAPDARPTEKFFDAVIGSPYASKTLKEALKPYHRNTAVPGARLEDRPSPPDRPRHVPAPSVPPAKRRLRVYAIDPSLSAALETSAINDTVIAIPWEDLAPGPVGEYVEVIDHDPSTGCFYEPVNLEDPNLLASDGLAPNSGDPRFHQQMVYAVAMRTIRNFELALGRTALWAPKIDPDGKPYEDLRRAAAHLPARIARAQRLLRSGEEGAAVRLLPRAPGAAGRAVPGRHRLHLPLARHRGARNHARPARRHAPQLQRRRRRRTSLAFHEAFADIVALFQHFSLPEVLRYALSRSRGDLGQDNILAQIGQEFGAASGMHRALRSALGATPRMPSLIQSRHEPHDRGAILVAAVFGAFVAIYTARTRDLMRMASRGREAVSASSMDPDLLGRLAAEARKAAGHVLTMCIRALDYCPPVDITFGEYLRALITADFDVMPGDERSYRIAFVEAFRKWGIYPTDLTTLSPESLRWRGLQFPESQRILGLVIERARKFVEGLPYRKRRHEISEFSRGWRKNIHDLLQDAVANLDPADRAKLALDLGLDFTTGRERFEVHALRLSEKTGEDNRTQCQIVLQVLQHRNEMGPYGPIRFSGGCTLIADARSLEVRYTIVKGIGSTRRLEENLRSFERSATLRQLYLGGTAFCGPGLRFAVAHRMGEEN